MTNGEGDRLDRIEALLERFVKEGNKRINSNAKAIEAIAEDRRRIDEQISQTNHQIAQIARNQGAMFEIIQELSKDRVTLSENLASIAQSLAKLAGEE